MIVAKSMSKSSVFSEKVTKVDLREKQRTLPISSSKNSTGKLCVLVEGRLRTVEEVLFELRDIIRGEKSETR